MTETPLLQVHGTCQCYTVQRCRCDQCRHAISKYRKELAKRRADRHAALVRAQQTRRAEYLFEVGRVEPELTVS